ncbi:hypothetical protein [Sphingomonas sp.]|uniref:hypothetical protein n=1 Tax=Sphingomonas sp. TaxID=28214 RepID=UPI0035BC285B
MQFLKILFWCLLAFLAAVFTVGNWNRVDIHLWNGITASVNLPLLLLIMFLAGLVPTLAYHHAVRWRLRQRLQAAEQRAAVLSAPVPVALPATLLNETVPQPSPPTIPTAVA